MDYRNTFYKNYISTHTNNLYSNQSLSIIEKEFPIWNSYFSRFLPKTINTKILDIGCGDGGFVYWLQKNGFAFAEGVDISDEQVEQAKKLNIKNIYKADAQKFLASKKNIYDIIFAKDFFEHLNKEELLAISADIHKALKEGGMCIIQTVNAETLFSARLRYADITHENAFTATSISQLLRAVGFTEIKVYPLRPVVHGIFSLVRYLLWRCIEICLHTALIAATGYTKGIFTQDILCVTKK